MRKAISVSGLWIRHEQTLHLYLKLTIFSAAAAGQAACAAPIASKHCRAAAQVLRFLAPALKDPPFPLPTTQTLLDTRSRAYGSSHVKGT